MTLGTLSPDSIQAAVRHNRNNAGADFTFQLSTRKSQCDEPMEQAPVSADATAKRRKKSKSGGNANDLTRKYSGLAQNRDHKNIRNVH